MLTCCPVCSHIFDGEYPCKNCGFVGPYYPKRTVDDLDEPLPEGVTQVRTHHKIDGGGH